VTITPLFGEPAPVVAEVRSLRVAMIDDTGFVRVLAKHRVSPGWRYVRTHFGVGYRFEAEPLDGRPGRKEAELPRLRRDAA
jgi:hypothetical protein